MLDSLTLTPPIAVALFLVLVFAGRGFRQNWKAQAPGWQRRAWLYGLPVVLTFMILAFLPFRG